MLLLEGVNRVKFLSHRGDQAITTDTITADIVMCFNLAWADIATLLPRQSFRKEVTIPTVQGTEVYSIATSDIYPVQELIKVHYIWNLVNYNLYKCESEKEFWGQYYIANAAQNRPFVYCKWGLDANKDLQIRLFPIPNDVYSLIIPYYIDPTAVLLTVADLSSELLILQPYLQKALWKGALYYYLDSFDDPKAESAYLKYKESQLNQDVAEDASLDSDLQFRFDTGRTRFVDPATGIRLQ